jgi:hypothetical protein
MRFDEADTSFIEKARLWIASVDRAVLANLESIFDASPGYYPTILVDLWRQEARRRGLRPASSGGGSVMSSANLPVGHPGDYEWRFTESTADMLLSMVSDPMDRGGTIMHVGAPTTFMLGIRAYHQYRHVLLDSNISLINALMPQKRREDEIVRVDLSAKAIRGFNAAAAIVDPPWYPGDTIVFLSAISNACCDGASILLCQPTEATRPGVNEERQNLLSELIALGLEHTGTQVARVRYLTPHFEAMSLAMTLRDVSVPAVWRKGDLLLLKKTAPCEREITPAQPDYVWREARFGPVRIKLRSSGANDLESIVPGDVLDTVSRRDPVRARIGFWTSGNRVFNLAHPMRIASFIGLCHNDFTVGKFSYGHALDYGRELLIPNQVTRKLFDVLLIELQEHMIGGEISW